MRTAPNNERCGVCGVCGAAATAVLAGFTLALGAARAATPIELGCGTAYAHNGAAYRIVVVVGRISCSQARSVIRPTTGTLHQPRGWRCAVGLATRPDLPVSAGATCTRGNGRDLVVLERIHQPPTPLRPLRQPPCAPGDLGC